MQKAGIAALLGPDAAVREMNEIFRQRRDSWSSGLNEIAGRALHAARRRVLRLPQRLADHARTTRSSRASSSKKRGVACGGGSSFGPAGKGYLRFSYAASLADIDYALHQLAEYLPKYKG